MAELILPYAQNTAATAATGNATHTTAATDYAFAWMTPVHHVMLQNNTSANVLFDLDTTTSTGSPVLAPGSTLFLDVVCTILHLQTAANQNVNGTVANNVVVRGWV